jgi:hypothetical protein
MGGLGKIWNGEWRDGMKEERKESEEGKGTEGMVQEPPPYLTD